MIVFQDGRIVTKFSASDAPTAGTSKATATATLAAGQGAPPPLVWAFNSASPPQSVRVSLEQNGPTLRLGIEADFGAGFSHMAWGAPFTSANGADVTANKVDLSFS